MLYQQLNRFYISYLFIHSYLFNSSSEDANVRARRSQPLKRRKSDGSPGESSTPVRKSTG